MIQVAVVSFTIRILELEPSFIGFVNNARSLINDRSINNEQIVLR